MRALKFPLRKACRYGRLGGWARLARALGLLGLILGLSGCVASVIPFSVGPQGEVVLILDRDGQYPLFDLKCALTVEGQPAAGCEAYRFDPQAGELVPLTAEGQVVEARLSPDGQRLLYVLGGNELRIRDLAAPPSSPGRPLWEAPELGRLRAPSLSPDGRRLAFLQLLLKPRGFEIELKEWALHLFAFEDEGLGRELLVLPNAVAYGWVGATLWAVTLPEPERLALVRVACGERGCGEPELWAEVPVAPEAAGLYMGLPLGLPPEAFFALAPDGRRAALVAWQAAFPPPEEAAEEEEVEKALKTRLYAVSLEERRVELLREWGFFPAFSPEGQLAYLAPFGLRLVEEPRGFCFEAGEIGSPGRFLCPEVGTAIYLREPEGGERRLTPELDPAHLLLGQLFWLSEAELGYVELIIGPGEEEGEREIKEALLKAVDIETGRVRDLSTAGCTVTVRPGESLQAAIDAAEEGAVLCLSPGTYEENLTIAKGLTLRGLGADPQAVRIVGVEWVKPVIRIESDSEIEVKVEKLTVAEAGYGIVALGRVKVVLIASAVSGYMGAGIILSGSARVSLTYSEVSRCKVTSFPCVGLVLFDSAQATLTNSQVSDNGDDGLVIGDSAHVLVRDSRFLNNEACGIRVESLGAQVQGGRNEMRGNGADLCGYAPASLRQPLTEQTTRTRLAVPQDYKSLQEAIDAIAPGGVIEVAAGEFEAGLTIWKPVTLRGASADQTVLRALPGRDLVVSVLAGAEGVRLEGLTITGSTRDGLWIYGGVELEGVRILGNGRTGLEVRGASRVTLEGSLLEGNSTDALCSRGGWICNGLKVRDEAHVELRDTTIRNNTDWGIAAVLFQCGYMREVFTGQFTGQVVFEGENVIEGNNTSGNQDGMGNPGDHPWNRPEVPDGQVCLP